MIRRFVGMSDGAHKPDTDRELPSLNGLRAVAILLVLFSHSFGAMSKQSYWINIVFKHGGLGVRLFFIISGFLITTLCLREREEHGDLSLKRNSTRDAHSRILPASYVYLATIGVLALDRHRPSGPFAAGR